MNLHDKKDEFSSLILYTANHVGIPEQAVRRDYYIVMMLQKLEQSEMSEECVFKGGTSLSKCYPGSIERFSEDIDLTFVPTGELTDKQYDRNLKKIEEIMSAGAHTEKIAEERNNRNKSMWVWFPDEDKDSSKIKLEIGSSVRPDPYDKKQLKTYIQEYLEFKEMEDVVSEYELSSVSINTLSIERTFLDKVMSVKRHAVCGTLENKVRHIYDVTRLYSLPEIKKFLNDKEKLKKLLIQTKNTDSFYLNKRNIAKDYNPTGDYDYDSWRASFNGAVKSRYEHLHEDLLYTNKKQDINEAMKVFMEISRLFSEIGE